MSYFGSTVGSIVGCNCCDICALNKCIGNLINALDITFFHVIE